MTVVNPDSIAGITSVTSSGTTLEFYDVNGNLLDVSANLTGELTVGTGATISSPGANIIDFETNGSEKLRITSAGNLLIGKTADSGKPLEVYQAGDAAIRIQNNASGTGGNDGLLFEIGNTSKDALIWNYESANILFGTAGTERLRITSTGSVGIGTNNPDVGNTAYPVCQVHGTSLNSYFKLTNSTTGVGSGDGVELSLSGSDAYLTNRETASIIFRTAALERARIESNGKIAIGNHTGASHDIHIKHASSPGIRIEDTTNTVKLTMFAQDSNSGIANFSNHPLLFYTNSINRIQLTSDGKVQIGLPGGSNSLPSAVDSVSIRARDEGNLHIRDIGNLTSPPSGSGVGIDVLNNASNTVKDLCVRGANIILKNASAETLRITSSGGVTVKSGGQLRVEDSGNNTANSTHTTGAFLCNLIRSDTGNNNAYNGTYFMNRNAAGGGRKAVGILETGLKVGDFTSNLAAAETIKLTHDGHVEIKTDGGRLKIGAGNDLQMYHDNGGGTNHITCVNNHHLKLSAQSTQFYDYTGVTQYLRVQSGDDRVRVYGESAVDGTSSGADGFSIATGGGTSCPLYFGTETDVAQKSMYLKGYWIYLRGHVNEGMKFIFSQGGAAPHGNIYEFKYNSAKRPGNSTTWDNFSDSRAKENVQSITNGIEKIKQLRPVTFDWTDDYADSTGMWKMDKSDPKEYNWVSKKENGYDTDAKNGQYGFLAQEYETVLPKDVKKEKFTLGDTEISDFRSLNHDSLIATLTAALKESITKIETLESEIQSIKTQQANDAAYESKIDKIIDYFKL